VAIDMRGNLCGDILIFIGPKENENPSGIELMELIRSDARIDQQAKIALKSLKQKLTGLTLLPKSLVWLINIVFSLLLLNSYSKTIIGPLVQSDFTSGFWHALPILLLTAISIIFGKAIGFKLLKPVINAIIWITRTIRKIRNRTVSESQG
jgi:hypothetical protein